MNFYQSGIKFLEVKILIFFHSYLQLQLLNSIEFAADDNYSKKNYSNLKIMKLLNYENIRNKFSNIIQIILNLRDEYSFIGRLLIFGYPILYNLLFTIEKKFMLLKNRLKYGKLYFEKIYWTNPEKIRYSSKLRDNMWYYYSQILNGDWDLSTIIFEYRPLHQSFIQRFKEGKKWEYTEYYQRVNVKSGYNKEVLEEKLRKVELLYYEIKKNGYKQKRELSSSNRGFKKFDIQTNLDEISVDIGRNGQLLVLHGKHRLSIAKLLDIPKIPIIIIKRHTKWMEFRQNLKFYYRYYKDENQDQVFTHPDLQNILFNWENFPLKSSKKIFL